MFTNYDAHKLVIYKYTSIMLTYYAVHKIIVYDYELIMLTNHDLTES